MRLTREESREQTRERLIEAARLAVARDGYDATSIGDIAEGAGFSKGAFFSNFESKEALLLELLRRHKVEQIAILRAILTDNTCKATLWAGLEAYIHDIERNRQWTLLDVELELYAGRTPAFAIHYREMQRKCLSELGTVIANLFERSGRIPQVEPETIAMVLMALISGLVLSTGADPAKPAFGSMIKLVIGSLLDAAPHTSTSAS